MRHEQWAWNKWRIVGLGVAGMAGALHGHPVMQEGHAQNQHVLFLGALQQMLQPEFVNVQNHLDHRIEFCIVDAHE
jgi:hypothetical protein